MKKIFFVLFLLFISTIWVNANSGEIDYTLIDCINWDNDTWVAFDSTKPYSTLKVWIENTINYINANVNKVWKWGNSFWKIIYYKSRM